MALDPWLDTQLVNLDAAAPHYRFDGQGSILLGEGWARPERYGDPGRWFAWALDGRAEIFVPRPVQEAGTPYEFIAEVRPFSWEGHPEFELSLWQDDRRLGVYQLEEDWQQVRFPLPDDALLLPLNHLELRFNWAMRPSDVGLGADGRALSASFKEIAFLPGTSVPGTDLPRTLAASRAHFSKEGEKLTLPPGVAWSLPMPPSHRVTVDLPPIKPLPDCHDCRLEISLASSDGQIEILTETTADEFRKLSFETPGERISRLRMAWWTPQPSSPSLVLSLHPRWLEKLPRDPGPRDPDPAAPEQSPHVFLYLVDTLRADSLEPYGGLQQFPSAMGAFARDAVTYTQAWSSSAWTLPATVSMMTGVYPDRHGVMTGRVQLNAKEWPTLASRLAHQGYGTAGFSHSLVASPRFGLDAGFEHFEFQDQLNGRLMASRRLRRSLMTWLENRPLGPPLFAYLHSVDPHAPYAPEGPFRQAADAVGGRLPVEQYNPLTFQLETLGEEPDELAHLKALYQGEVDHTDLQFGRFVQLLKHLGLYGSSVVLLVSDHGEEFAEHGAYGHGRTLYEEQLKVPLIIKYPEEQWAGMAVEQPVSTVDITPTLLRLLNPAEAVEHLDGKSLLPTDMDPLRPRPLLGLVAPDPSEDLAAVNYQSFRLGNLKCIKSLGETDQFGREVASWQVFDLEEDPEEQRALAPSDSRSERCMKLLERWMERRAEQVRTPGTATATDPETLEQLRALGYLGG